MRRVLEKHTGHSVSSTPQYPLMYGHVPAPKQYLELTKDVHTPSCGRHMANQGILMALERSFRLLVEASQLRKAVRCVRGVHMSVPQANFLGCSKSSSWLVGRFFLAKDAGMVVVRCSEFFVRCGSQKSPHFLQKRRACRHEGRRSVSGIVSAHLCGNLSRSELGLRHLGPLLAT